MAQIHLTAEYRPQRFTQVVGQEAVARILSRAAAEDKIAPAYMFSGTRGVGKTTVARILAKAVNCSQGPAAEPCNACEFCRQITQGTSLDVVEIDGASHTGVDHVRKLTEDVSYAPLQCRYKVVIIDEAHMLSRSAFNALLKTLEEPPGHVSFVLATTEPHKFPATIVSRCQHFVFQRVDQATLEKHMAFVLDQEGVGYDPAALRVLARKGAGSVRDCLSLLSQVLALGETEIRPQSVQSLLGLAGGELMTQCVQALMDRDCRAILELVRRLLDDGLDISFFLQDLALAWRNLFILKQTGEEGLGLMEMPEEEARGWLETAGGMSAPQIHAAWQMTLEGQKRVVSSPDPALALELMLMNLAFLPDLVDIGLGGPSPAAQGGPKQAQAAGDRPGQVKADPAPAYGSSSRQVRKDWPGFLQAVRDAKDKVLPNLHLVQGRLDGERLELICPGFMAQRMQEREKYAWLQEQVRAYFGASVQIVIRKDESGQGPDRQEVKKKFSTSPRSKRP